jgi:arginase
MGPSAIRYAGLEERLSSFGCRVVDRGNVTTPEPEALAVADERARFLPEILGACARLAAIVGAVVADGAVPLVLGGDHSVALGTLAGLRAAAGEPGGVIWIDAHGDLNTPDSSPSGNVHGMPLAAALGMAGERFAHDGLALPAVDVDRVVLVGVRSLDPAERTLIRERGIRAITMTEIDRIGIEAAMREAIDRASGPGFVHVSLDLDALDPEIAPGVGTPVKGGLTYREAHLACEDLAEAGIVGSLELVEVNPILDRENGSASIAVELAASALGQSIL